MLFLRIISAALMKYVFYGFILFSVVVSLISGFADTIYYSRQVQTQEQWIQEARSEGEEFIPVDYTPNLLTGIAAFLMFAGTSTIAVMFLTGKFSGITHGFIIASTALAVFILLLPRPAIGTNSGTMKEVFAFLMILGIISSVLFRDNYLSGDGKKINCKCITQGKE